jgi:hypothetical protein
MWTNHIPLKTVDLKVNGYDLMNIGVEAGPLIGMILNYLMEKVLEDPTLNTKEKLLELTKKWLINFYIGMEKRELFINYPRGAGKSTINRKINK